jgi:threonine synthase
MARPACLSCRALYPDDGLPAVCPTCGGFWGFPDGLSPKPPSASGDRTFRRWAGALGLAPEELPERVMGSGPVLQDGVLLFHEGGPSRAGTFKERGAEVLAAVCARRGLREVFLDSSGNAGIAMAAACAARGIRCRVLVPETTPETKLRALRAVGAELSVIPGDRQAAADAAAELRGSLPYASHVYQPFFPLGVATLGWEIAEATAAGHTVERVVLPAGNGSLLLGVALGLDGRLASALPEDRPCPALHAVQLAGYASLAEAFGADPGAKAPGRPTAAGIAVADPPRRAEMIETIRQSGGDVAVVTEEEIAAAREDLDAAGHPTDPTGATAWAGLAKRPDLRTPSTAVVLTSTDR